MYLHNHTHNYYIRHQTSSKAYVYISLFYLTLQPSNAIMWYFWKLVHKYTWSHLEQEVKIQQKKLFVVSRVLVVTKVLIIVVNDIDAKEYSGHSRVLVVTGTQCKVCIKFLYAVTSYLQSYSIATENHSERLRNYGNRSSTVLIAQV